MTRIPIRGNDNRGSWGVDILVTGEIKMIYIESKKTRQDQIRKPKC